MTKSEWRSSDVTHILSQIENGNRSAAEQLLPLVYDELRKLAAAKLSQEKPGQTLQATALVHEAYLRLVGPANATGWEHRGHFFAAAAEAMRRIMVEQARRKQTVRHGRDWQRKTDGGEIAANLVDAGETLAVDEFLSRLAAVDARAAQVAKLRLFLDCTFVEIGEILQISADSAREDWSYARAWLKRAWVAENRTE